MIRAGRTSSLVAWGRGAGYVDRWTGREKGGGEGRKVVGAGYIAGN